MGETTSQAAGSFWGDPEFWRDFSAAIAETSELRTAEVIDMPDAVEPLVDYFRSVAGEHDDWEEYRAAMVRQGKCLIRVTIDDWGPIATGGFPPEMASRSVD